MKPLPIVLLSVFALSLLLSPPSASALTETDLLGTWSGYLLVTGKDKESKEKITMEFKSGGIVVITPRGEKAEEVPFLPTTDGVLFMKAGSKEPEARLKKAKLQGAELRGELIPAAPDETHRWKIELYLKKQN